MSKLYRALVLFIFQLVLISTINGQDAVFSQYYSSSLYLSPCFAGTEPNLNIGVNTRTQWKSVGSPYVTNQLSIIKPFHKYGLTDKQVGGIGLSIYQDKAGDFGYQVLGASLSGAYNIQAGEKHTISLGLQAGIVQKRINPDKFEWGTQFDPFKGFNPDLLPDGWQNDGTLTKSKTMLDIGAGLLYYFKAGRDRREKGGSFWLGYSAYHLNRPNESLISGYTSKLQMSNKALAGIEFTMGSRFNLSPNVLAVMQGSDVKEVKGLGNMQVNTGMYITYMFVDLDDRSDMLPKDIVIGGWYRLKDSYIASIGFVSNIYTLGFSYDLNQSGLKAVTGRTGAWEVSLKVQLPKKEKVKRYYTPRI